MSTNYNGVINIYKEAGDSSHTVVAKVSRILGKVKAGHTGTLDPMAEGVLPVCIGKGTKLADYIQAENKIYKCTLKLGNMYTTWDTTGEIIKSSSFIPTQNQVIDVLKSFEKEYFQLPPMYSAIKQNGKKLYELAREGIEVERKKRLVNIFYIKFLEQIDECSYSIEVFCSKGTYIRSLCHEIGLELNTFGAMENLVRLKSGDFSSSDGIKIQTLAELVEKNQESSVIIPMEEILKKYPKGIGQKDCYKYLYNGNKIELKYIKFLDNVSENEKFIMFNEENLLIGIYELKNQIAKPVTMLTF